MDGKRMNKKIEIDKVYNCDCLDLRKKMIREGVKADWCITDPPYGIGYTAMASKASGTKYGDSVAPKRFYAEKKWDNQRISKEYFDLMFQCSKNQIIFGGNYYTDYLPPTSSWIVWDKRCDDKMRNNFGDCELAWCSDKGVARVFHYLYMGMLQGNMKNKDDRFHPTQKPTELWGKLIAFYTKPNDLILDPFMGSFTTAVCCHRLQRHFIGAELDKDYFEKGQKRLEEEINQISFLGIL